MVVEALWAAEPVFGRANMVRGIQAIRLANDPANTEGRLPPDGEPKELLSFPELHLAEGPHAAADDTGLGATAEMAFIARIDPKLAELAVAHHNLVYRDGVSRPGAILPAAALELIAIAALCIRGATDLASEQMRRALPPGVMPPGASDEGPQPPRGSGPYL